MTDVGDVYQVSIKRDVRDKWSQTEEIDQGVFFFPIPSLMSPSLPSFLSFFLPAFFSIVV